MAKKIINVVYKVDKTELEAVKKTTKEIEAETKKTETSFQKLGKTGAAAYTFIGTAIAAMGLATIGKQIFDITAEFQKLSAVLTNTLGSRSAAQRALADIKAFAAATPFSVVELTDAFVKLANQGFKPTIQEMRKLGDLASAQAKSFNQLTEALIDAQTGEFERLKEFGIRAEKAGDKVTFTFKGVKTQTDFTADSIRKYILTLGDLKGVSGGMAAISETLGGKLSNMGDNVDALLNAIGTSSGGLIGGFLDLINSGLGGLNAAIDDNSAALRTEQAELNLLVRAATSANTSTETRALLIDELNKKYPDFLRNLDAEKITNEQLTTRMEDVNDQFVRKIALQLAEKEQAEILQGIIDARREQAKLEKTLIGLKDQEKTATEGSNIEMAKGISKYQNLKTEIEGISLALQAAKDKEVKLKDESVSIIDEYVKAFDIFKKTKNDYFDDGTSTTGATTSAPVADPFVTLSTKLTMDTILDIKEEGLGDQSKQLQEYTKQQLDIVDSRYDQEQDKIVETAEFRLEKEKETEERSKALKQAYFNFALNSLQTLLTASLVSNQEETNALQAKYDKEYELAGNNEQAKKSIRAREKADMDKARLEQKTKDKQAALAKIGIDTAVNIIRSISNNGGVPLGLPFGALAALEGIVQAAAVSKFKDGGWISGPGTPTSDSVPIMASRDEFMVNAASAAMSPNLLEAINSGEINDNILRAVAKTGGSQVNVMDDSGIIRAIQESRVDYISQGYTLMKVERQGSNFKRYIRSKVQGY